MRRSSSRSGPTARATSPRSHVAWRFGKGAPSKPSILLVGDLIFMVNDGGIVGALDAKTGEMVWRGRIEGTYSASPIVAGGRIYAFNEDGKTTVLEAGREFKVLAENFLPDGFMASPAVDGRALYLRTRTARLSHRRVTAGSASGSVTDFIGQRRGDVAHPISGQTSRVTPRPFTALA